MGIFKAFGKQAVGAAGERAAADYLKKRGWRILDTNWRAKGGELDIVAQKNGKLVFVEVKTIKVGPVRPEENITEFKRRQLIKLARVYLAQKNLAPEVLWQIDIIAVEMNEEGGLRDLRHLENAVF